MKLCVFEQGGRGGLEEVLLPQIWKRRKNWVFNICTIKVCDVLDGVLGPPLLNLNT